MAITEKALGPEHPGVATSPENYSALLWETGRSVETDKIEARSKASHVKRAQDNQIR